MISGGKKATYRGDGTVNGQAGYRFVLIATDGNAPGGGGVDKFRIKIWQTADNVVVYDNELAVGDDAAPTTAIGGGSIVVHGK